MTAFIFNFTAHPATASGNIALADLYTAGSMHASTGQNTLTRADTWVLAPGGWGSANATLLQTGSQLASFTAGTTWMVRYAMGFDAYLAAFTDAANGGVSAAAIGWSLQLDEIIGNVTTTILYWSPAEINNGMTATSAASSGTYAASGTLPSPLVTLTAGRTYTVSINQLSNSLAMEEAAAVAVPEPASAMLVLIAIAGLAGAMRRRQSR